MTSTGAYASTDSYAWDIVVADSRCRSGHRQHHQLAATSN